jgi:hypothetical protein
MVLFVKYFRMVATVHEGLTGFAGKANWFLPEVMDFHHSSVYSTIRPHFPSRSGTVC